MPRPMSPNLRLRQMRQWRGVVEQAWYVKSSFTEEPLWKGGVPEILFEFVHVRFLAVQTLANRAHCPRPFLTPLA